MQQIKTIDVSDGEKFNKEVNELLAQGYKISSTSCGFINSESYEFCSQYFAILVIDLK